MADALAAVNPDAAASYMDQYNTASDNELQKLQSGATYDPVKYVQDEYGFALLTESVKRKGDIKSVT